MNQLLCNQVVASQDKTYLYVCCTELFFFLPTIKKKEFSKFGINKVRLS